VNGAAVEQKQAAVQSFASSDLDTAPTTSNKNTMSLEISSLLSFFWGDLTNGSSPARSSPASLRPTRWESENDGGDVRLFVSVWSRVGGGPSIQFTSQVEISTPRQRSTGERPPLYTRLLPVKRGGGQARSRLHSISFQRDDRSCPCRCHNQALPSDLSLAGFTSGS